MAFRRIGAKAISHRGLQPQVAVRADAQLSRHAVGTVKTKTWKLLQKPVGVILRKTDGSIPHQIKNLYNIII